MAGREIGHRHRLAGLSASTNLECLLALQLLLLACSLGALGMKMMRLELVRVINLEELALL